MSAMSRPDRAWHRVLLAAVPLLLHRPARVPGPHRPDRPDLKLGLLGLPEDGAVHLRQRGHQASFSWWRSPGFESRLLIRF